MLRIVCVIHMLSNREIYCVCAKLTISDEKQKYLFVIICMNVNEKNRSLYLLRKRDRKKSYSSILKFLKKDIEGRRILKINFKRVW